MLAPRSKTWSAIALSTAVVLAACGGGTEPVTTINADGGESSGTGGPPHPSFTEPASGQVLFPMTRVDDLSLNVIGVLPGITELFIDGHSLGPMLDSPAGELDAYHLTLRIEGSMVPGRHRMALRTADATGEDESEIVTVDIVADVDRVPVATLDDDTGLSGRRLLATGDGDEALLLVLDDSTDPPRLHVLPAMPADSTQGWTLTDARTLVVPGLALTDADRTLPISAVRYVPDNATDNDPSSSRLRVAWRVGPLGTRIDIIDAAWSVADEKAAPRTSITVDEVRGDRPAQWAQLGRPWLMGNHLLVELDAPLDVESPRPGDRSIMQARLHEDADGFDPFQRVQVGPDRVDVDRLGPAIDGVGLAAGRPSPISIRIDRTQPRLLDFDPATGILRPRETVVGPADDDLGFATLPLATVVGAFGSRTVAGLSTSPSSRFRVSFIDDRGNGGVRRSGYGISDLPDFPFISGELAPGSVDGVTVFMVPYGAMHPVHMVHAFGSAGELAVLDDEIRCDSIAIARRVGSETTPWACTREGTVWWGTLSTFTP